MEISEQGLRELEIWLRRAFDEIGGGGGLQYHRPKQYGAHNIGDWFWMDATAANPDQETENFALVAMLFNAKAGDIIFKGIVGNILPGLGAEIGLSGNDWQGYLAGGSDLVYTQRGDFIRYLGGGDAIFYTGTVGASEPTDPAVGGVFQVDTAGGNIEMQTCDAAFASSGDFVVTTQGGSNVNANAGDISLHAHKNSGSGQPGAITIRTSAANPAPPAGDIAIAADDHVLVTTDTNDIRLTSGDDMWLTSTNDEIHTAGGNETHDVTGAQIYNIGTAGQTLTINDHLGSPLVTYTG